MHLVSKLIFKKNVAKKIITKFSSRHDNKYLDVFEKH